MVFFSLFVMSAIMLGAGAMLAPAWPTTAPRIGLAATLLLGLVSGGAVWWAELFAWDTLIIDYLLFAIVSGVILGGTLARGGENSEGTWPSRKDLLFLAMLALISMLPLFVLKTPLGENALANSLTTQAVLQGGGFSNIALYYPDFSGYAPPAFHALAAYLSQQLHQDIASIQMALGVLFAFLCLWVIFDLGAEIQDKRLGYSMALVLLLSVGMLVLLWGSYYSQLMALLFSLAFISYAWRYIRAYQIADMLAAGLMLGVVFYLNPLIAVLLLVGYYVMVIFAGGKASPKERLGLWLGVLAAAGFGVFPYLLNHGISPMQQYFALSVADFQLALGNSLLIYCLLMPIVAGQKFLQILQKIPFARRYFEEI